MLGGRGAHIKIKKMTEKSVIHKEKQETVVSSKSNEECQIKKGMTNYIKCCQETKRSDDYCNLQYFLSKNPW